MGVGTKDDRRMYDHFDFLELSSHFFEDPKKSAIFCKVRNPNNCLFTGDSLFSGSLMIRTLERTLNHSPGFYPQNIIIFFDTILLFIYLGVSNLINAPKASSDLHCFDSRIY